MCCKPGVPHIPTAQHRAKQSHSSIHLYKSVQSLCSQTTTSVMGKFTHLML